MPAKSSSLYSRFARGSSRLAGRPATFALMLFLVIGWAAMAPVFDYSDAWQLTINTVTTILTFLMVFLIQHTQNRDGEAIQIKLDEIIRAQQGAHNALLDLEDLEEEELMKLHANYLVLAERARRRIEKGKTDTDVVDLNLAQSHSGRADRRNGPESNLPI